MPGSDPVRVTLFNNMVSPYTNKLFNRVTGEAVRLTVVSCVARESNRHWGDEGDKAYEHVVLKGVHIRLNSTRYAHLNFGIGRALARSQPDALVINGFYPSMVMGTVWAGRSGTPLALTTDGWAETMPRSPYHSLLRPKVLRRCRKVFVCGVKGRDYALSQGIGGEDVIVVPLVPAWPAPRDIAPHAARPYHLLWVAQINDEVKNAAFFADVAIRLNAEMPGLKVRIVGDGSGREALLSALDQGGVNYDHTAAVPWGHMADVFASGRILVLPSLWEPWGLVCNEAMQCGTPCIVSPHVGAGDDLVVDGRNGWVEPLEAVAWKDRLLNLLRDPLAWQAFSERAQHDAGERTLDASAERLRNGLERLAERRAE